MFGFVPETGKSRQLWHENALPDRPLRNIVLRYYGMGQPERHQNGNQNGNQKLRSAHE